MSEFIHIDDLNGLRVIRIDRLSKKNALTQEMYQALSDGLHSASCNDEIGAVVLCGSGGVFTAGNDIADFQELARGDFLNMPVLQFLRTLACFNKPLLAAVDGLAIGVGTTMLFHCDMVFSSQHAVFQTPFVSLGLVPEAAASLIAPRLMGHQRAFELLVAGARFDAAQGQACGFVNDVLPHEDVETHTFDVARHLVSLPREAIMESRSLLRGDNALILERIEQEARLFQERLSSDEAQAAFASFYSKE